MLPKQGQALTTSAHLSDRTAVITIYGEAYLLNSLAIFPSNSGHPTFLTLSRPALGPPAPPEWAHTNGPILSTLIEQDEAGTTWEAKLRANTCVRLPGTSSDCCFDVNVTMGTSTVALSGLYTLGSIRPLNELPLTAALVDVILHGTLQYPTTLSMATSASLLSFSASGKMTVDLSGLATSFSALTPVSFDYIDYVAIGNVRPVPAGGYMAKLGRVTLPSPFGPLDDVWVAFATSDLLGEVQLPGSGPLVVPQSGMSLYFESSPLPYICNAPLLFSLLVQPSPLVLGVRGRCSDLAFDLRLVDRYDSYQQNLLLLPTINFVSLTGIEMSIEMQTGGTSSSLSFSVAAAFQMETGALSNSYCAPATDGTASASTQCLRAQITATAASLVLPSGPATSLTLQLDTLGLWLEPLGLRNFAVADPSFGLGAQVFTCPSPIGFCASPQLLSWNILVAYKKSGSWPARMNTFSSWDGPSGHCTLPPRAATCFTPCVLAHKEPPPENRPSCRFASKLEPHHAHGPLQVVDRRLQCAGGLDLPSLSDGTQLRSAAFSLWLTCICFSYPHPFDDADQCS